ncbi:unnamed protein product [Ambrosiozyma monospora]|uniref:Unnamed protein product n=1 Tax=Ambrosiozyma monospora TaxID=43982 RepID=A0ACB5UDA0_AMBMO|nr:unnamed protein product [Ambrosiozyma monospora]
MANTLDSSGGCNKSWSSIHCNLAHVYRKQNLFDKSLLHFNKVLRINNKDVNVHSAIGLIYLKLGKVSKAIEVLHVALSILPNDPIALDLLDKALESNLRVSTKKLLNDDLLATPGSKDQLSNKSIGGGRRRTGRGNSTSELGSSSSVYRRIKEIKKWWC